MTSENATSVWFRYNDVDVEGDVLRHDFYVPKTGLTQATYYCCLTWNEGNEGGGYCGIQDHPDDGRNYIFSLWNPKSSVKPIVAVFEGPGTETKPFGGEGEGLKAMNYSLGWEPDHWYTIMVRRWSEPEKNNSSLFGFYAKKPETQSWSHIVTFDYPVPDVFFKRDTGSFLEDWMYTGKNARRVHFKNGFKRTPGGVWIPFSKATFKVTQDTSRYKDNINCGITNRTFFLASGGNTKKSPSAVDGKTLEWSMPPTKAANDTVDGEYAASSRRQYALVEYAAVTWNIHI